MFAFSFLWIKKKALCSEMTARRFLLF